MQKKTYFELIEPNDNEDSYGAFFPDFPGCTSQGDTLQETLDNAKESLELHYYGLEKDGDHILPPSTQLSLKMVEGCYVMPI